MKILFILFLTVFSGVESYAAKAVSDTTPILNQVVNATADGPAWEMGVNDRTSFHASWTEVDPTFEGTFKIQVSSNGTDWDDLSGMSVAFSGSGSQLFIINVVSFRYARFYVDLTSGTGTITIKQRSVNAQ